MRLFCISLLLLLQPWVFKMLVLGSFETKTSHAGPEEQEKTKQQIFTSLGEEETHWVWNEKGKVWLCDTVVKVSDPGLLSALIAPSWQQEYYNFEDNDSLDARSECQKVELKYRWNSSRLYLTARFKKYNGRNNWVKT